MVSPDYETPESECFAAAEATTSATTTASLPSSQSNGSLQNLVSSNSDSPPPRRRQPLVNRRSNPIISTEGDDDDENNDENASLDGHLKFSGSSTEGMMAMAATAAIASISTNAAASTTATMNGVGHGTINYDNIIATSDSVEMPLPMNKSTATTAASVASVGSISESYNPKKLSPLSSRISVHSDQSSPSSQPPNYIPSTLIPNSSYSNITPNNTTASLTPCSTLSSPPNSNTNASIIAVACSTTTASSFDFDATHHNRRKGTGYLASQISLSTPTDVFASGCTLLQLCAIGNLPAVKEYISKSFTNVNFRDYDRRTALHVAASEGHVDVVKYLVGKGANVNRSDRWGGSPLDDAHRHRHGDVARYLRSKGGKTGSLNLTANLIAAAAAGDMEEVTMICADVVGTNSGVSQLVLDLSGSRRKSAAMGIQKMVGNNNDGGGGGGRSTILDLSSSRGKVTRTKQQSSTNSLDVSEPTVAGKNGLDINSGDYDKRTALHLAAGEGHLDVVQFLCKRGANVNIEDRWGGRPLDDALQKGNERVAEVLRKYGATSANDDKVTPWHRSSKNLGAHPDNGTGTPGQSLHDRSITGSLIEDENFRVDFSELEMIERIGSGAFGEIYKCRWRGILVAAKCIKASKIQKEWLLKNRSDMKNKDRIANRVEAIKQTCITEDEKQLALEDFRRETAIMRRLRHPNIVMMLAYSHSDDVEVMISEICRCSLLDIFMANNISNSKIPKRTQIGYAKQLAQGMNHLHKSRPPIIHRDLKPANLLVDFNGTIKIADFGLAKIRPNPEQLAKNENEAFLMTGETGSYRFMAPEVFRHEDYTETVDVYSYAMIFYYVLLSKPPWAGLSGLDAVTKAAVDGERPLIPRNVDERLSTLLKRCWDEDQRARPSFEEIITCLNIYSHDVFSTDDKDVTSMMLSHDQKCGCVIS